jgi:MSHA pilin protein MshC
MNAMAPLPRSRSGGFTLTELVTVIVIASILSIFAMAQFSTQPFNTEGFANQVAAMVRYAQKLAVAQRRTVFVVATTSSIKLCYADATCATPVREPPGTANFLKTAPSGVSLAATTFSFDALGKPYDSGGTALASTLTIPVTGDVTRNITVQAQTGYVQYVP